MIKTNENKPMNETRKNLTKMKVYQTEKNEKRKKELSLINLGFFDLLESPRTKHQYNENNDG